MSPIPSKLHPIAFVNGSDPYTIRIVGANLSIRIVAMWHRSKANTIRLLGNVPPESCAAHEYTRSLPNELAEMIIAHLTHDIRTLKMCSLTCRSWYTIAVPHIHHTLVLGRGIHHNGLKPLSKLHGLGLIPFVQEIRLERLLGMGNWFMPRAFGRRSLRYFSALSNVHTLRLQRLEICRFIPQIERYFGQFSPTLRSIVLSEPFCSPRQLSHFLSFFPGLDDIKIWGLSPSQIVPDATFVPSSPPKPRGRLALGAFLWVETWARFIASCGGLRFHYMELWASRSCELALLEACAETLETLRFHATDRIQSGSFCVNLSMGPG